MNISFVLLVLVLLLLASDHLSYQRHSKVAFATSDEEGNKECTMLCGSADLHAGPWFMRHFSDTAAATTWAEMDGLADRYLRPQSSKRTAQDQSRYTWKEKGGVLVGVLEAGDFWYHQKAGANITTSKYVGLHQNVCYIYIFFFCDITGHQNIPYITGHQNMVCVAGEASMGKGGCG